MRSPLLVQKRLVRNREVVSCAFLRATHLRRDTVGWVRFFNEVKKRNPAKPRIRKMLGYVICASLDKLTQPTFLSRLKCVAGFTYGFYGRVDKKTSKDG